MTDNPLPAYLTPGYPESLIMLRVRNQPDAIRDELWEVLTRADKAAHEAWKREGGVSARAVLDTYFPGDYEAWMCNAGDEDSQAEYKAFVEAHNAKLDTSSESFIVLYLEDDEPPF